MYYDVLYEILAEFDMFHTTCISHDMFMSHDIFSFVFDRLILFVCTSVL